MNHRWWVGNDAGDVHGVGNSWHLKMSFNGFAPFVLVGRSSHGGGRFALDDSNLSAPSDNLNPRIIWTLGPSHYLQ